MSDHAVYRTVKWEMGQLGHVCIIFPDPVPPEELADLESLIALWLKGLRRRSGPSEMVAQK